MEFPVFDLHCDTTDRLIGLGDNTPSELKKNTAHVDLERAASFPGYTQCFACFTAENPTVPPVDTFEKKLNAIYRELYKNSDLIRQAYTAQDIEEHQKQGLMSAVLTIEGPAGFGYDPELLSDLYAIGFRISTLGWNESNPLTGSHITGEGLTELGKQYVVEAQRLGMIVDVSHISDAGFWDIMDITTAPIIATHSNSRHIRNVSRNLTDEMFLQICKTGGVTGINLFADFLGDHPTIDTVCDHILHFLDLDPTGTHIALGADLDGCNILPAGFSGVQDYPKLASQLINRGVDESTVYHIFWKNALEVLRKCCT